MKAVVVEEASDSYALSCCEADMPALSRRDVLVRVEAAGVCSHEIACCNGKLKRGMAYPFIPGHEMAGTVCAIGEDVHEYQIGDRVAATQRKHICGVCEFCRAGKEASCPKRVFLGHGGNSGGAYAEYCAIGAENLCTVPASVSMPDAAIAACVLGTGLNALRDVGALKAGETALITGAGGGLGLHALQIARLIGATVIAVTSDAAKVPMLEQAGADIVLSYDRGGDFSDAVKAATNGRGVDLVMDNVGSAIFHACRRSLATGGRWMMVGELTGAFVTFNLAQLFLNDISLLSVRSSTRVHLKDCLALLEAGRIRSFIHEELPLEKAQVAHELVKSGAVTGRLILRP